DDLLVELLLAIEKLHSLRTEMHTCLKQGFFNMTKARRSMGQNSVTVLNTREEYSAQSTVIIREEAGQEGVLAASVFTRDRGVGNWNMKSGSEGSLRQRTSVGVSQWTVEEASPQAGRELYGRGDSLNLFTGLVPPPLRRSKRDFSS
ncbi:unnamed protein product, partial [Choristocarpus tenellus]